MHVATDEVVRRLRALGVSGEVRHLDAEARTAAMAAAQLGVDVGAIANSLVFRIDVGPDAEPLLVLTSGSHRVDTAVVARHLGVAQISRADPDFVRRHTGQSIGGIAPVGHPGPVHTLVDIALAAHPVVWAAAGHPHAVFPTSFDELVRITGGTPMAVGADG